MLKKKFFLRLVIKSEVSYKLKKNIPEGSKFLINRHFGNPKVNLTMDTMKMSSVKDDVEKYTSFFNVTM